MRMRLMIAALLCSAAALGQSKPEDEPAPKPTFTKEPVYHLVPHCPKGYEAWYEPKGDGCPSWGGVGTTMYLDHKIGSEGDLYSAPDDVVCRKVGSKPKVQPATACPL